MTPPVLLAALLVVAAVLFLPGRGAVSRSLVAHGRVDRRHGRRPVPEVEIASVMELVALTLESGCGVLEALETVGAGLDDVLGDQLLVVAAATRWGVGDDEAWGAVPASWAPVARALRLASMAGAPPAELLLRGADDIRRADRHRLEAASAKLGVRVVLPLGLTFLPAFVATTIVPLVVALTTDVFGR